MEINTQLKGVHMELTLSIIKPDAVKRNLIGEINSIIERNDIQIVAQKMLLLSTTDAQNFYLFIKREHFLMTYANT